MQYLDAVSKMTEGSLFVSKANHSISWYPSLCPNQQHWRSWSWTVPWRSTRPFRTNTPKRYPFHYRGLECKSTKSRNTRSNRQIWPWNAEWSRAKTNRVLPRKCTGHSKHPLPTTREKPLHMDVAGSFTSPSLADTLFITSTPSKHINTPDPPNNHYQVSC